MFQVVDLIILIYEIVMCSVYVPSGLWKGDLHLLSTLLLNAEVVSLIAGFSISEN